MKRALLVRPLLAVSPLVCSLLLAHCRPDAEKAPAPPSVLDVALSGPRARGDLDAIRERGVLRILVPSLTEEHLPRVGTPDAEDRAMAQAFAERLGVEARFLVVARRSELFDLLDAGYGDLVTAQLTVTGEREKRFRFTRPTDTVTEWLVGRRGAPSPPRRLEDLNGREVHVRKSSAFVETLQEIAAGGIGVRIVFAPENLDSETLAYEVSRGMRPLTVLDSNLLATIESYDPDLERLFPLREDRELAWLVRNDAPDLAAAADAFIIESYLTDHRVEDRSTEGLATIRDRGSLRVITLNNPVHYFLYRGRQMGFDYELARLAARRLGVRLEMVVPPRRDLVFDWLLEGRGDVIATTLTVTPERQDVLAFSRPYMFIEELVVRSVDALDKISSVSELRGRSIHAWRSSSHYQTLSALRKRYGPFEILPIPEEMEFEEILDRVSDGGFEMAVLDSHILEAELPYRPEVEVAFPLLDPRIDENGATVGVFARDKAVAFALRKDNPDLLAFMDGFVADEIGSLELNVILQRYFARNRNLPRVRERRAAVSGRLSPYDELFKKYAKQYGLDWRLMVAQAYQESRFDPDAESWAGAIGLFQVLPSTGLELGFERLTDPEIGIHAGVKHMSELLDRFDRRISLKHRLRFALAAFNAGWGHLDDARRLALDKGWDPDKWFGNTEKAMLLLSKPEYYRFARHGYVRGAEPVHYVSEIQNRYDHYVTLVPP